MSYTHLNPRRMLTLATAIGLLGAAVLMVPPSKAPTEAYIVQGASLASVKAAVVVAGGEITHELGVIRAVGAMLTATQREALRSSMSVQRIYDNRHVKTAKNPLRTIGAEIVDTALSEIETTAGGHRCRCAPRPGDHGHRCRRRLG